MVEILIVVTFVGWKVTEYFRTEVPHLQLTIIFRSGLSPSRHTPSHMVPSIFKTVLVHQILLTL